MKINVSSYTHSLQLLSDGIHLAAGLQNGLINIYNLNDGSLISKLIGHTTSVFNLVLERNRDLLISSSGDKSVLIWNLTSNTFIFNLTGHTSGIRGLKLISFDTLATGSGDGTLKVWNLTMGTLIKTLPGHTSAIEWSVDMLSDKQTIVSGSQDKTIKLWNLQTGKYFNTTSTGLAIWSLFVLNTTLTLSS
jgi:WD40 repeat protein